MARENEVVLENVKIIFRNFEGKEGPYNRKGDRNFAVLLTAEMEEGLKRDGWNVKYTKEREDGDGDTRGGEPYLPVSVNFGGARPPLVVMITAKPPIRRTNLDEDTIEMFDYADIVNVDLIVNPYDWNVNGASGRKAYLKSIYVTINEDELERKYADTPFAGAEVEGE